MAKLSQAAVKKVEAAVDELFERAKIRLLGPRSVPKKLYVGFNRSLSLPGVFESALGEEGGVPDLEMLQQLIDSAGNYLDSLRLRAKSRVVDAVQAFVNESAGPNVDETKLQTALQAQLYELMGNLKYETNRIVDTETQKARNFGGLEGISRVNASMGISDPVVFFVVVKDTELCDECRKLHLLKDGRTPRVWHLSELGYSYHKRGDPQPKVGGLHPHCRCSMTTLMPGFGFTGQGLVAWKGDYHNEWEAQRAV